MNLLPIRAAIEQALDECYENNGMKTTVQVKGHPHQVRAYRVGQNVIRIDVVFEARTQKWDPDILFDQPLK